MESKESALENAIWALLRRHGTHGAAAKSLGISQVHYSKLRNGKTKMTEVMRRYIILSAGQV